MTTETVSLLRDIQAERCGCTARSVREAHRHGVLGTRAAAMRDNERAIHQLQRLHVEDIAARRPVTQAVVDVIQIRLLHRLWMRSLEIEIRRDCSLQRIAAALLHYMPAQ